jgi:hypothetical protein
MLNVNLIDLCNVHVDKNMTNTMQSNTKCNVHVDKNMINKRKQEADQPTRFWGHELPPVSVLHSHIRAIWPEESRPTMSPTAAPGFDVTRLIGCLFFAISSLRISATGSLMSVSSFLATCSKNVLLVMIDQS